MNAYERSIRENLPPPGYVLVSAFGGLGIVWVAPDGAKPDLGLPDHRAACLAAWEHWDAETRCLQVGTDRHGNRDGACSAASTAAGSSCAARRGRS